LCPGTLASPQSLATVYNFCGLYSYEYQYIAQCSTLATLYKWEYTVSHYFVFSTFDILYREYRIARDEVLAVFV